MVEEDENFECPFCGDPNSVRIERSAGSHQTFTVDCETCCQPILLNIRIHAEEDIELDVRREND
ncbi:MAG: transcription elongation factor Elf1 [Candidatus Omnitrophota bacterium]|jgi:transcription elongation factor Elf1